MNLIKRVGSRKHCLELHLFSMKSIVIDPFMSEKTISITFFTDSYTQNFSIAGELVFPLVTIFFIQAHSGKLMFNMFINMLLTNTLFCKFHMVCTLKPPKIWWQTSVQAYSTVWFPTILNSLKWISAKLKQFLQ